MGFIKNVECAAAAKELPDKVLTSFGHERIVADEQNSQPFMTDQLLHETLMVLRMFAGGQECFCHSVQSDIGRHVLWDFIGFPVTLNTWRRDHEQGINLLVHVKQ